MSSQNESNEDKRNKEIEEILIRSGRIKSPYVWKVFLITSIPGIFNLMHLVSYTFIAQELENRCDIDAFKDSNWTMDQIRQVSKAGNEKDSCKIYSRDYEKLSKMPFDEALNSVFEDDEIISCNKFIYEGSSSTAEWNLICDRTALRSTLQTAVAFGRMIGALTSGLVADKFGRRIALIFSYVLYMISGLVCCITPWYILFIIGRIGLGFAGTGVYNVGFALLSEICDSKRRSVMAILYNMSYPLGFELLALIAYLTRNDSWRVLQVCLCIPMLVFILFIWLVPESPRWYVTKGKYVKAWKKATKADKSTQYPKDPPAYIKNDNIDNQKKTVKQTVTQLVVGCVSLFYPKEIIARVFISYIMWFVVAGCYMILSINSDNFGSNKYIYYAVTGVVEALGYLIPIPMLQSLGRKLTTLLLLLISAISLLSLMAFNQGQVNWIMTVAMVGRLCIGAAYAVVILYTSEIFPTEIRSTAIGTSSVISYVGIMMAPYVVDLLGPVRWDIPSTICGVEALIAGLLCTLLPETQNKALPDFKLQIAQGEDKVSFKNIIKYS